VRIYELPEAEAVTIILWAQPILKAKQVFPKTDLDCIDYAEKEALEAGLKIMGRLAKEGLLKPGEDPVALVDAMIGVYKEATPDW